MFNLSTHNETLTNMTANIAKANTVRANTVQSVIRDTIAFATENKDVFTNKKTAVSIFLKQYADGDIDNFTKRAVKVTKSHLVDGYKIRFDLLSIAQMEKLIAFNKNLVNKLYSFEGDEYIQEVKELIKSANIEKTTKVFSAKKAKNS